MRAWLLASRLAGSPLVLNDEVPLPGEMPLLVAALDVLVALFRIGGRP